MTDIQKITLLIVMLLLVSCANKNYIYYEYNGVTITRIDKGNELYFYYGKYNKNEKTPSSYIKATYHGFDGEVSGYLKFLQNRKVELVEIDGYLDKIGNDSNFYLIKLI